MLWIMNIIFHYFFKRPFCFDIFSHSVINSPIRDALHCIRDAVKAVRAKIYQEFWLWHFFLSRNTLKYIEQNMQWLTLTAWRGSENCQSYDTPEILVLALFLRNNLEYTDIWSTICNDFHPGCDQLPDEVQPKLSELKDTRNSVSNTYFLKELFKVHTAQYSLNTISTQGVINCLTRYSESCQG